MHEKILVVHDSLNITALAGRMLAEWQITVTATGRDGLKALAEASDWSAVLAATRLPDMEGVTFLAEAARISDAVPLLLAPDATLAAAVHAANSGSIFRVVPQSSPVEHIKAVIRDAVCQHQLIRGEHELRARVEALTTRDALTGCRTRAWLHDHLNRELRRCVRYSHYLSVILCDLDGLKDINELFGMEAGDQVLAGFGRTMERLVRRDIDVVSRWGEDEFLLVLPETTIRGAGRLAQRIQKKFAELDLRSEDDRPIPVAASYGIAGFAPETPDRNTSLAPLLLIAGRCLAQAKSAGGNQVLCCP